MKNLPKIVAQLLPRVGFEPTTCTPAITSVCSYGRTSADRARCGYDLELLERSYRATDPDSAASLLRLVPGRGPATGTTSSSRGW